MKGRRAAIAGMVCFISACVLSGCKSTELEERSFPMLLTVGEDGSQTLVFDYIFPNEWSNMNAYMDYNHLKVIILEKSMLDEGQGYIEFLAMEKEQELLPRNTYVCVAEDTEQICEYDEQLVLDVGTYIETMLKAQETVEKSHLPTLGDLLDDMENQMRIWKLPILSVTDGQIEITSEYQMVYGFPLGEQ